MGIGSSGQGSSRSGIMLAGMNSERNLNSGAGGRLIELSSSMRGTKGSRSQPMLGASLGMLGAELGASGVPRRRIHTASGAVRRKRVSRSSQGGGSGSGGGNGRQQQQSREREFVHFVCGSGGGGSGEGVIGGGGALNAVTLLGGSGPPPSPPRQAGMMHRGRASTSVGGYRPRNGNKIKHGSAGTSRGGIGSIQQKQQQQQQNHQQQQQQTLKRASISSLLRRQARQPRDRGVNGMCRGRPKGVLVALQKRGGSGGGSGGLQQQRGMKQPQSQRNQAMSSIPGVTLAQRRY